MSTAGWAEIQEADRRQKVLWGIRVRALLHLGFAATYLAAVLLRFVPSNAVAWAFLACFVGLNAVRWIEARRGHFGEVLSRASIALDVVTIGTLIYFSGGVESVLCAFLVFHGVAVSISKNRRVGLPMAIWAVAVFGAVLGLELFGVLPHSSFVSAAGHEAHCRNPRYVVLAFTCLAFLQIAATLAVGTLFRKLETREKELAQANTRLSHLQEETERLSVTDELTGVRNRRYFNGRVDEEIQRSRRFGKPLCLMILDLDYFKRVNDTYGHAAGDQVLRTTAQVMSSVIREVDVIARYGGEEFGVLLPETQQGEATSVADRIRSSLERQIFVVAGTEVRVTASVGLAELRPGEDREAALSRADRALYQAKELGRNRVQIAA